jgi:hypothetical protein
VAHRGDPRIGAFYGRDRHGASLTEILDLVKHLDRLCGIAAINKANTGPRSRIIVLVLF